MVYINKFFSFFILFLFLLVLISSESSYNSNYYYPTDYYKYISSYFGYREIFGTSNFHTGVDFLAPEASPVRACRSGVVKYRGFLNGYGNCIIILHDNGYKSLYAHLSENFIINIGDYVNSNQIISNVGPYILSSGIKNGNTTGPHLHFELYNEKGDLIDPLSINYLK